MSFTPNNPTFMSNNMAVPMQPYGAAAAPMFGNGMYNGGMTAAPAPAPMQPAMYATAPTYGYGGFAAPMMQQPQVLAGPETKTASILTAEDRNTLKSMVGTNTIVLTDEEYAKCSCDHKNPDGTIIAIMDNSTGLVHCDLCGSTFKIATVDKDSCRQSIAKICEIWETAKLLNINIPADVMRQIAQAMAIIANILPPVYDSIYKTWQAAYQSNIRAFQGQPNPWGYNSQFNYRNSADALNALQMGGMVNNPYYAQAQYNAGYQYPAYGQQPYAAQQQVPVMMPNMTTAQATGPNAFVNNTPAAAPAAYPQQANVIPPAPTFNIGTPGAITPAMMMGGVPQAAQQAAAPVNIPGTAPAAAPAANGGVTTDGKLEV